MPKLRRTTLNAYRQLAEVEKHDNTKHFHEALGGEVIGEPDQKRPGSSRSSARDLQKRGVDTPADADSSVAAPSDAGFSTGLCFTSFPGRSSTRTSA
jgi:hypothetical protein